VHDLRLNKRVLVKLSYSLALTRVRLLLTPPAIS
jgi:hypothetical protein